jgi:hypothetical protein
MIHPDCTTSSLKDNKHDNKVNHHPIHRGGAEELKGIKGLVLSVLWFITGKFLELDDKVVDGLLERQKSEHSNIALVGALLMTITFSYLPPILEWEDDWLKGAFAFTTSMCNCFVICAVSLSTGMLLCLNLLKDDTECRIFLNKLGYFELVPFQSLWISICLFGFVVGTLQFYKLINYNNWFAFTIAITYFPAVLIVPLTTSAFMKALFSVRKTNFSCKVFHCDGAKAKLLLQEYIDTKFEGDEGQVPADKGRELVEFYEYVKSYYDAEYLSRKLICTLKQEFEQRLGAFEY